jgi:FG-GAP-like repeat
VTVRRLCLCVVLISVCEPGWAQQFRKGTSQPTDFFKTAIERRLQSKHPLKPADPRKAIPGKYLLDRVPARANQLQSRIRQTNSFYQHSQLSQPFYQRLQSSAQTVFPGIELRPALQAGAIANSVVSGDFNHDGHMDFVVANGGTDDLWIYLGNGDGTFQLPRIIPLTKGLTPVYLAAADLRRNGILDLIVSEFDTATIGVLLGNGDGTFGYEQVYVLPQPAGALVVDDFNRDGNPDVVAVMVTVNNPSTLGVEYLATLFGDGKGGFAAPVITLNPGFYSSASSITSGDVNNDGFPDVLIVGPGIEGSQIYLNAGNGTFTPGPMLVESGPFNIVLAGALGDVNGDGCLDALVADGNGYVWILPGDCAGNFPESSYVPMGDSNASVTLADVNRDGHLDIVTTTISLVDPIYGEVAGNMMAVAFGDGTGNFTPGRDYVGTGISYSAAIADFNGDGHPDVVSVSPDTDTATVYLNDGSGGFGFPQGEWIGLAGVGVLNAPLSAPSFVDLNGDGKTDVLLLDEGYNGEYFITALLNDGTGRFSAPVASDAGVSILSQWMGDYRLGDFRNTGHRDFVGIGLGLSYSTGTQYIVFAPGNGDGTFGKSTYVPTSGAEGEMTVGDFNGDGKLDFVAVGASATGPGWVLTTFLGNGDGTFRKGGAATFTDSAGEVARVFVGDFNHDAKLDVIIYDTGNGYWTTNSKVWEFLGNGNGTFQPGIQLFSSFQPMTMADVNGNSALDIVRYDFMWPDGTTQTFGPARFSTYLDQPSGAFTKSSSYAPYGGIPLQAPPYLQFGDPTTSSFVADLNGDGKLDEIAFQQPPPFGGDTYAQILMGNGDGTFTPTFDVFDLQKVFGFPAYAHVLDGSRFSDLLEIDGSTSSMHVFKGGPAPALQLALEETKVTGNTGCGWVFLNLLSSSDTNIILSSSVPGVIVPGSTTVVAGSLSQRFCYSLSANYDWHQVFDIRAQLGSDTAVAYAWESYIIGFTESISPNTDQAIYPGQSTAPITVSVTSLPGYSSTVQLSCVGLLAGETCSFGQNTLSVSPGHVASTSMVVNTNSSTNGTSPVTVVASDANVSKREALNVFVAPLLVYALNGGLVQTTSPGTGTGDIIINGIPPYHPSCSGLPPGVTCSFSGSQVTYPNQTSLTVSVNVPAGVAAQNYAFTVRVASGPIPASLPFTLVVQDFSLQPPASGGAWAPPGAAVSVNLSAQSINLFSSAINVSCTMNSGSCTGGSFWVSPNGSLVNLTISEPSNAVLGADTLTVTGSYGSLSHTVAFPFYVADYAGTLSTSTLKIAQGNSGSITANITATQGFSDTVSFSCSGTGQLTCQFSPPTVQPTAGNPQTTTITIKASGSAAALHNAQGSRMFLFGWVGPVALIFGLAKRRRLRRLSTLAGLTLMTAISLCSCGGGSSGSGGGGGGSYSSTVTVNAVTAGAKIAKTLGTIDVTVTY